MTVRTLLKMGDLRLLRLAQPVTEWGTPALEDLVRDMLDTMAAAQGAGLAAPQIGVDLQVVIFGSDAPNPRYPDRSVDGFHARVVQHECDHLVGVLYPMRVRDFRQFGFTDVLFPGLDASEDD
jgi:peptide deformylase